MALPADALKAVVTVGVSSDISGVIGTIKKLRVQLDECVLIWAKTGHTIEDWSTESVDASFIELEVLADQPGLLTSGLVDGKSSLVEIQGWPLLATWIVEHPNGKIRKRSRRFSSSILTPGSTVDLGLIPNEGLVPPAIITYAQNLHFGTGSPEELAKIVNDYLIANPINLSEYSLANHDHKDTYELINSMTDTEILTALEGV